MNLKIILYQLADLSTITKLSKGEIRTDKRKRNHSSSEVQEVEEEGKKKGEEEDEEEKEQDEEEEKDINGRGEKK